MIRSAFAAIAVIAASACTPVPEVSRAETCVADFQRYDRALLLEPDQIGLIGRPVPRQPAGVPGRWAAMAALHQHGCVTFPQDLPQVSAEDLKGLEMPRTGTPQALRYLHLGAVVNNETIRGLRRTIAELGYPVRVEGAETLGARVFIGPLRTREAMTRARRLADVLGFEAVYALRRIP